MGEECDPPPGGSERGWRLIGDAEIWRASAQERSQWSRVIGNSPVLRACLKQVTQAAKSDIGVLIRGETGTGKELFARTIHLSSRRQAKQFISIDCRSWSDELTERLLFGTQQPRSRHLELPEKGWLAQADQGTLFLDEVGELPQDAQTLISRFLLNYRYRPVDSCYELHSDVRLIAATSQNLNQLARSGQFRVDLLGRLQGHCIELPSLSERRGDLELLCRFFLECCCQRYALEPKAFTPEFLTMLQRYPWPGNVRELSNVLEQAFLAARYEKHLFPKHLPSHIRIQVAKATLASAGGEKGYLRELMARCGNNMTDACLTAGLTPSRLYALLKKHQLFSPQ